MSPLSELTRGDCIAHAFSVECRRPAAPARTSWFSGDAVEAGFFSGGKSLTFRKPDGSLNQSRVNDIQFIAAVRHIFRPAVSTYWFSFGFRFFDRARSGVCESPVFFFFHTKEKSCRADAEHSR